MEINLDKSCGRGKPKGAEAAGEGIGRDRFCNVAHNQ